MSKNKDKKKKSLSDEVVMAYTNNESLKSDPNGSWTGVTIDRNDRPVQDADDL